MKKCRHIITVYADNRRRQSLQSARSLSGAEMTSERPKTTYIGFARDSRQERKT
jgi:hypothetical protein